ncbi:Chloride channel protein [Salmonella sp. NCTC 11881]|nr:Chloride channel protein [Salmonella sp. NCTC 11881]
MQQMAFSQTLGAGDYFTLAVVKLAALVIAAASGFRGGRIFSGCVYRRGAGAHAPCPC